MAIKLREAGAFRVARGPVVLQDPVLTRTSIYTGEGGEFLARLDKRTGRQIWRKRRSGHVRCAHGDKVLVYVGDVDETQLWGEDGKVLWKRSGMPGLENGRLFENEGGRLRTIDVLTGAVLDEFECPPGRPNLMHDDVLLLTDPDGATDPVQAVDLTRQRIVWRRHLASEIKDRYGDDCPRGLSFAASCPGQLVAKSGRHLVALSLADGTLRWGLAISVPYLAPLVRDGRMYIWSAPSTWTSTRVTFDLDSGQITRERSEPSASENRFVIVDEAGGQIVVDRPLVSYGAPFRRVQEVYGGGICRNHVLFTSSSGLMALFRLSDGELVWQHEHRDQLFSPVFEDNRVYVACADGTLVVFEAEGGEL
jgi:outer membrane protein assembly factor BamB